MPDREEILWHSTSGQTEVQLITHGVLSPSILIGMRDPAMWNVASFSNTVRNGEAEIVWRSTAGDTEVTQLHGGAITANTLLNPNVDQYWHVAG